jgi:cytochrome b561
MLELFKLVYFWNPKINAVGMALAFLFAFFRYKAISDLPWYAKVLIAILLSWGFAVLVFLARVCWEVLNNAPIPTMGELKEAMRELDEVR